MEVNLTRGRFEEICEEVFVGLERFLQEVDGEVRRRKVRPECVEIFGGGSRIPRFQQMVGDILGWQVKRTVNSSESIARGCSLFLLKSKNQSKLSKYQLKQKIPSEVYLLINFFKDH